MHYSHPDQSSSLIAVVEYLIHLMQNQQPSIYNGKVSLKNCQAQARF